MKIGMSNLACPDWTLEQVAAAAREYGYQGVELRLIDGEVITPSLVRANLPRLRHRFSPDGLALIGLGSSVRFTAADPAERGAREAELIELIDLAAELHAPFVRTFGGQVPLGDDEAAVVARVVASLNRCAPAAERAGVTIALETHDDFSRSAAVAAVLAQVPSPAVGALWDTHHPYRMGEPVAVVWGNLLSRLVHVHLKDARHRADGGWDLVPLGDGEVPCREIVRALALRGYAGWLVVEWEKKWHPEIAGPEVALPQHLAVLQQWLRDV